jgi:uncharacterized protein YcbX
MKLSEINIFPVKSLGGISLETSVIEHRGLRNDRRWMLVDEKGKFLTQREIARMSLVKIERGNENFTASSNGASPFEFPLMIADGEETVVVIWNSIVKALAFGNPADEWFSEILGRKCRLVFMPESSERSVNEKYAVKETDIVNFADGYPFMLIGQASLDDLNSRLVEKLPMNRFRPNFVVSGSDAFAEDDWKKIRIGDTVFDIVKPCERCVITTIDQQTAIASKEPLRELSQYRNFNGKILFGQNLIAESYGGTISVGDEVEVIV